jgi:hypothetical protein
MWKAALAAAISVMKVLLCISENDIMVLLLG